MDSLAQQVLLDVEANIPKEVLPISWDHLRQVCVIGSLSTVIDLQFSLDLSRARFYRGWKRCILAGHHR